MDVLEESVFVLLFLSPSRVKLAGDPIFHGKVVGKKKLEANLLASDNTQTGFLNTD